MFINVKSWQTCLKTLFSLVKFDFTISTFFQKPKYFYILAKNLTTPRVKKRLPKEQK